MSQTFRYHTGATSWSITIWLTAEAVPLSTHDGEAEEIAEGIWVSIPDAIASGEKYFMRLSDEEHDYLKLGMRLIAETVQSCAATHLPLVVRVQKLEFGLCDYQPEGLACAMAGWAAQEWNFPVPVIPVRYDKPKDVYFFKFPGLPEMGTHALDGHFTID